MLLAVDNGALEREERDAVLTVEPVCLREHARQFLFALVFLAGVFGALGVVRGF